jgi:F420-dependent oxidoreductase-like protein
VKLALSAGYWSASPGGGHGPAQQLAAVREAERLGYDSVWTAEAYGSDAATVLGWLAGQTTRIRLGAGILQMPARSPAMTAMTAATLDRLSGGRMLLGIGSSGPQVAEGWHGQRFAHQLQRTREYVAVVRMALERRRVEYHGQTLELPLPDGPGKALKLTIAPVSDRIPIYLAAIGPRNIELAGEIADGWLPILLAPEHLPALRRRLQAGAARAGRSLEGFDIVTSVSVLIDDDLARARDAMRPSIALYVGGMGSRERNFYNRLVCSYGFEDAARTVQEHYLAGDRAAAMAAVPDELIDMVTLAGPADVVRDRLRAYRAAGVGAIAVATVPGLSDKAVAEQLRLVAELAEQAA